MTDSTAATPGRRRLDALAVILIDLYVPGEDYVVLWQKLLRLAGSGQSDVLVGVEGGAILWRGSTGPKRLTYNSFMSRWKQESARHRPVESRVAETS